MIFEGCLLLNELPEQLGEILLKGGEDLLSVLYGASELIEWRHALRDDRSLGPIIIMVVDEAQAETLLQSEGFREVLHKLDEVGLALWVRWVIHEDDALTVLLAWGPALLILEVSGQIPQLYVDLAKLGDTWWWVTLEVNNSAAGSWPVNS